MLRKLEMSDMIVELSGQDIAAVQKPSTVPKPTTAPRPTAAPKLPQDTGKGVAKEQQEKEKGESATAKDTAEDDIQRPSTAVDAAAAYLPEQQEGPGGMSISEQTKAVEADISSLRDDVNSLRKDVDQIMDEVHHMSELTEKIPFEALYNSVKEIDDLKSKLEELTVKLSDKSPEEDAEAGADEEENPVAILVHELEEKLNTLNEQVQGLDSNFTSQIEGLIEQIGALECDLGQVMEQVNTGQPEGDAMAQDFTGLGELQSRLQQLQSDMEHVNQVTTKLMDDEEERQLHYEALVEQVEVLKMVKADREVVEDALAEKADQIVVNRKVSHEQFDNACDDLARGLDEAFTKLCQQETIWKNALDDVQNEIGLKLDKVELTPLRDYIQQRLKVLQEKLKALAARKELEAAGSKKLLRDVNCISCDKDVVMKRQMDVPNIPMQPSLPPARSIRPYLTYELDKLRHQQKRPLGKNLLQLEDMEQDYEKKTRKGKITPEEEPDHLVNRYCGGSHTVLAPHQRVMRPGQPAQLSPEALGFTEITLKGTDGQLYHGQEMPPKTPKKPDVTEATQTSETLLKTPAKDAPAEVPTAKGDSKATKPKTPDTPKSPTSTKPGQKSNATTPKISARQGSKGSRVAFAEPQQQNESPATQGS